MTHPVLQILLEKYLKTAVSQAQRKHSPSAASFLPQSLYQRLELVSDMSLGYWKSIDFLSYNPRIERHDQVIFDMCIMRRFLNDTSNFM